MKTLAVAGVLVLASASASQAHMIGDDAHDRGPAHYDWSVRPPSITAGQVRMLAMAGAVALPSSAPSDVAQRPTQAKPFELFAPKVKMHWDESFLFVEGNGLPAHKMMVGITTWQQQVPLPQPYFGDNGWRIPLHPVPAIQPQAIKNHFLRGAIALAVNGIPIFNPQNNRGEISQEIGELDQWGGHCGRADDYHYHAAPLHLQTVVGNALPIAFALDGYPIFGLTEPDGSAPANLDAFNGHETAALGYHYHASMKYPYVNGGFHGEVVERGGQVDPQPRARPVRQDQPPLRGAKITGFSVTPDEKNFALQYSVNGKAAAVNYSTSGAGIWKFQFAAADGTQREETYRAGDRPPGANGPDGRKKGGPPRDNNPPPPNGREGQPGKGGGVEAAPAYTPRRTGAFVLRSPVVTDGGALPVEFTGDGAGSSPPLEWSGSPPGTRYYAVIMHHFPPGGGVKWYWTLYNVPADIKGVAKDARGVGVLGNNCVNDRLGYAPPHSKGPGAKTYILTAYALSGPVQISTPPSEVNREVLLSAMKDLILDSAELKFVYDRTGIIDAAGGERGPGGGKDGKGGRKKGDAN